MGGDKMRISDYPYGKVTKTLKAAVKYLNSNKNKIGKLSKEEHKKFKADDTVEYIFIDFFDYPDYWNIPKKISSRLGGDEVDWIQSETYDWIKHWWDK